MPIVTNAERNSVQFAYPYLNNNGTSASSLIQARITARSAILKAIKALEECAPHGRDYQTAPDGAYEAARLRYEEQYAALARLQDAIYQEAIFIQGQQP